MDFCFAKCVSQTRPGLLITRVAFHILLGCAVLGVGHAQESHDRDSATQSKSSSSVKDRVVLKVGDVSVTEAEFEAMIGDIESKDDPDKPGADKQRRDMGDDYASVLMLSQQAIAEHLDADPEIRRKLAVYRLQVLSDAQFANLLKQAKPTAEEISQYYSDHAAAFDRVLVHRLFIFKVGPGSSNVKGLSPDAAKAKGDAILKAAASGGDPMKLAAEFGDSDQGILDPHPIVFLRDTLPPQLEKVAFALKDGQWAIGDDTPDRLTLLHLVKRDRRPLDEVASLVEQRVQSHKMQTKLDELKKKAGIWMDQQYFGTAAVAAAPGEQRTVSNPPSTLGNSKEENRRNQ